MTLTRTTTAVLAVVAGAGVLAGCSGGEGTGTASAPSPAAAAATGATAVTTAVAAASSGSVAGAGGGGLAEGAGGGATGTGCAADGTGVPAGVASGQTVDVDSDGRPDTAWLQQDADGSQLVGITTASGATFGAPYSSGSPIDRKVLVADVDGAGTIAAIVSDGRQASLFTVVSCSLVPALNPQGAQYTFDLGFGDGGTGIGCSDVAGESGTGLVGLQLNRDGSGNPTTVTRTAVVLDGASASNGGSDTVDVSSDPTGPAATTATEITCGDLTLAADGVG